MKQKEHACRLCEEKWHTFEEQDVYEELQSGADGLDEQEEAATRHHQPTRGI